MQELLALITDQNAAEIVRSLSADELSEPFGTAAFERWLASDSSAAAGWISTQANGSEDQAAMVARALISTPGQIEDYLGRLPDGEWKEKFMAAAGFETASTDPQQAITLALKLRPGEIQNGVLQAAAYDWARRDPSAAEDWAEHMDDPAMRDQLIASAARGLSETDPRGAADWLVRSVRDQSLLADTAQQIVRSWAAAEPAAAADWVASFPSGAARNEALDTLVQLWAAQDSIAARTWANSLPAGPVHESAVAILNRGNTVTAE